VDAFVEEATEATPELVEAFARLAPQLSSSSPPPTAEQLAEVVASPATVLLVARLGGEGEQEGQGGGIVGTTTLVLFRIPTGMRAWIEDVVVDESARGGGVGEALTLAALERAADAGARTVDLTSRPSREAANRLYTRLGFALRETNVYRWTHPTT
jgi:ribosomal protein S18 acetylase RimI-like enzyme